MTTTSSQSVAHLHHFIQVLFCCCPFHLLTAVPFYLTIISDCILKVEIFCAGDFNDWMSSLGIMMASTMQHRQQHQQQQRYHTLGGQSQQSGSGIMMHPSAAQPSTLQRRMLANVRQHQRPEQQSDASTPICRCRVLYLGSAVPQVTKDGLQGIQVLFINSN